MLRPRTSPLPLLLLAFLGAARATSAQVLVIQEPTSSERAAGELRLRRTEERFVRLLRRSHGDPAVGGQLGEALHTIPEIRLPHPSKALRAQIGTARDPAALALAIAEPGGSWNAATYEIDVLLTAVALPASAARRPALWAAAAAIKADPGLSLAFLEQAEAALGGSEPSAEAAREIDPEKLAAPGACALASSKLTAMLDGGLSREAVTAFESLPTPLRKKVLTEWSRPDPYRVDRRLTLAAAYLLEGDAAAGAGLLASVEILPWKAGDPHPPRSESSDPSAVLRAVLDRWQAPPAGEDPFPLLAEFVEADLFGPGRSAWGVTLAAFGRLADREGYPELSRYAWHDAGGFEADAGAQPEPLSPAVQETVRRYRAALAQRLVRNREATQVAEAGARAHPRPPVRCAIDCDRLNAGVDLKLFALDRSGRNGIAILEREPAFGELFQIEMRDGTLVAVRRSVWQS